MLKSGVRLCIALLSLYAGIAQAQRETVYMAILSSFRPAQNGDADPGFGLYVSTDRGLTWQHRGWREYIRTFYGEEGSDGALWSACGNGVLRSTDHGKSWRVTTGWEVTEVLKVKAAEKDPSLVFASTAYGIFRTTDRGETWEKKTGGMRRAFSGDVCIDRTDPTRILAATEEGVYLSEDRGELWTERGLAGRGVRVIVQDLHDAKRFWLGTEENGVYCSSDGGRHWESTSRALDGSAVYTIAMHPQKHDWLYAGTYGRGVLQSTDGGRHWVEHSRGLTDREVHALVVLPSDPKVILAGTLHRGLFRSTDSGETWVHVAHDSSQVWGLSVRTQGIITARDGKTMVLIPGGTFRMGSQTGYHEEAPVHSVRVTDFYMDQLPVTNREFRAFCDSTGTPYPANPRWDEMPGYFLDYPDHPVVNVTLEQASAYASWAGKRIPTEVEWEYAACGGLEQPLYPWGMRPLTAPGRNSPTATRSTNGGTCASQPRGSTPPRPARSHPTGTACMTWRATSINGQPTGSSDMTTPCGTCRILKTDGEGAGSFAAAAIIPTHSISAWRAVDSSLPAPHSSPSDSVA